LRVSHARLVLVDDGTVEVLLVERFT